MQHTQRTSPTLTIADSIVARPLETVQPRSIKRARRPSPRHTFSPYSITERVVVVLFTLMLLSTVARHLPMLAEFGTYLWLMVERILGLVF